MSEVPNTESAPQREVVQLEIQSRPVNRAQIQGLYDVVAQLEQIKRAIDSIRRATIAPNVQVGQATQQLRGLLNALNAQATAVPPAVQRMHQLAAAHKAFARAAAQSTAAQAAFNRTLLARATTAIIPPARPLPISRTALGRGQVTAQSRGHAQGRDLLGNLGHVTAWSSSVFLLYGGLRLAGESLQSMLKTGNQIQRLSQVCRGVGGDARALADDILKLAAANGRSANEAMEAAIQWSRLGLSRSDVNEAVRVSLQAANVAELTAAESTEKLSSVMQAYQLRVGELAGVLAQLNAVSNTFNVSNKALFDGLARSAIIAKQARLPFSELVGILASAIGTSSQTGAVLGTAVKSIIAQVSNPEIQKKLHEQFKVELTTDARTGMAHMSESLRRLFIAYQRLSDAERRSMLFQTAGTHQAGRLATIIDAYVKGQVLAINAQLNLNSAEEENAKILYALRTQLAGLTTDWARFINVQGNRGPAQAIGQITEAMHHALRLLHTPAGGTAATGFMVLSAAMGAKLRRRGHCSKCL